MTVKIDTLPREFVDSKTNTILPDVNPEYTPDQVRDFLSNQFPHLVNAKVEGPEILKTKLKYKLVSTVGTKG